MSIFSEKADIFILMVFVKKFITRLERFTVILILLNLTVAFDLVDHSFVLSIL